MPLPNLTGLLFTKPGIIANDVMPTIKPNLPFEHPAMKTSAELLSRYGNPFTQRLAFTSKWIMLWHVPDDIHTAIPCLPKAYEINKDIQIPLEKTYRDLIAKGLHTEIHKWDGCFVIRTQIGSTSISRHSWGIAQDLNAAENPLKGKISWSEDFLNVWRNNLWICGADFHSRTDGMHMEWTAATAF